VILPVVTGDEAEADIAEAAIWYERRRSGLGAEFVRSIDDCLALISKQPDIFPVVYRQARMALPRKFPYLVIYRVSSESITIVAVIHGSRNPSRWKSRVLR
jgi:plasmid stabilization system protein ParE